MRGYTLTFQCKWATVCCLQFVPVSQNGLKTVTASIKKKKIIIKVMHDQFAGMLIKLFAGASMLYACADHQTVSHRLCVCVKSHAHTNTHAQEKQTDWTWPTGWHFCLSVAKHQNPGLCVSIKGLWRWAVRCVAGLCLCAGDDVTSLDNRAHWWATKQLSVSLIIQISRRA